MIKNVSISLCLPACVPVQVVETDAKVAEIHANSESFDSKAELSFKYLQVCDLGFSATE